MAISNSSDISSCLQKIFTYSHDSLKMKCAVPIDDEILEVYADELGRRPFEEEDKREGERMGMDTITPDLTDLTETEKKALDLAGQGIKRLLTFQMKGMHVLVQRDKTLPKQRL